MSCAQLVLDGDSKSGFGSGEGVSPHLRLRGVMRGARSGGIAVRLGSGNARAGAILSAGGGLSLQDDRSRRVFGERD